MAVVRNTHNNELYLYLGHDVYRNIRTGVEKPVKPELATKVFKINAEMTYLLKQNPLIENLIRSLDLKIEK